MDGVMSVTYHHRSVYDTIAYYKKDEPNLAMLYNSNEEFWVIVRYDAFNDLCEVETLYIGEQIVGSRKVGSGIKDHDYMYWDPTKLHWRLQDDYLKYVHKEYYNFNALLVLPDN